MPPIMLMYSKAQHEADEGVVDLFIEFQEVVMATVETQVFTTQEKRAEGYTVVLSYARPHHQSTL